MSLKLEAIHHVAVIGTDYARSRHFYAGLLGLPVIREHRREAEGDWKIDLQLGDAELELFIKPDAPPQKGRRPRGAPPHRRLHRKDHVLLL